MFKRLVLALVSLTATASVLAGGSGQFSVLITLNNSPASVSTGCTGASISDSSNASVKVLCPPGVFVTIAQGNPAPRGQFMPGFRPARDSLLPDFCREELSRFDSASRMTCKLDDQRPNLAAIDESGDGWEVEGQLFAVNLDGNAMQAGASSRPIENRGVLTALRLPNVDARLGPVEMLVSF